MQILRLGCFMVGWALFVSCKLQLDPRTLDEFSSGQHLAWNQQLSSVVIRDIFTPPVCSRIYAYPNVAAYEALVSGYPSYRSLAGQLNGLENVPQPEAGKEHYLPLASMVAFATVAEKLVVSGPDVEKYREDYLKAVRETGIKREVFDNSVAYGQRVGAHILAWAGKDNYQESKARSRYVLTGQPGEWQPTPPDYMPAIEPHWRILRPFALDSAAQCKPTAATPFDTVPGTKFHQEAMEVYQTSKNLGLEQLQIARFWDCNPNVSVTRGHVTFFNQKLSPGGHWLSIAAIAVRKKNLDAMQTAETFALTSISLADGFISCWDEKYKCRMIRPETYLERYVDPTWDPTLQTPPFPEYPSGHSVVSAAAATVLTRLVGSFAFTDSTELAFGMPARSFTSFRQAADEAAVSRLYGGIHFRPAIENGLVQGQKVGEAVLARIQTRRAKQVASKH